MKDKKASIAIEESVGLKPKVYSYLLEDNSKHKKGKGYKQECCSKNKS